MSISHTCPVCGSQLARIRAVADPVYNLPIVVCSCGFTSTRRRHPLTSLRRSSFAAARTILTLLIQIFFLIVLSLSTAGFIAAFQRELDDLDLTPWSLIPALINGSNRRVADWLAYDGGILIAVGALVFLASGAWLRATLSHWRRPIQLPVWAAIVAAWLWMESLFWPLEWFNAQLRGLAPNYTGPSFHQSLHLLTLLAISLAINLAAYPIGSALLRLSHSSRRYKIIKTLRKRRSTRRGE